MKENKYSYCDCGCVLSKLPLYIYPPTGPSVLMGWVVKCVRCQQNYNFIWSSQPNKYSSERVRQLLIDANTGKYTKGLTEAELFLPKIFQVREDDTDFGSYCKRFENLLKSYTGER